MVQGAAAVADACAVCGSADPDPGCWLCGWSWVSQASAEQEAAAEAAVFALMRRVARAERRVARFTGWVRRLRDVLTHWQAGHGRHRVVLLVADLMARDAAARTSRRGRPGATLAEFGAILATDARPEVGRPAMPGHRHVAELIGCSTRAVTADVARAMRLSWIHRVAEGRVLTLKQRAEHQRWRDRAAYEVAPLSDGGPVARAAHIPAAIAVLEGLLSRAAALLQEAQADLDAVAGRPAPAQAATRAQGRSAVLRVLGATQEARTGLSVRLAQALTSRTAKTPLTRAGISSTLSVGDKGRKITSGLYWVLDLSRGIMIHSVRCGFRPTSGRGISGASPTYRGRDDLERCVCRTALHPGRPRTAGPPRRRSRPEWADWAYGLARELRHVADLLDGVHPTQLAATLGGHLAPRQPDGTAWTVEALVDVLEASGGALPGTAAAPLALLRSRIQAMPGRYRRPDRVRAERHAEVRDQAAELAAARDRRNAELATRQAAVAASDPARVRLARRLARHAIRPAGPPGVCVGCDTPTDVAPRPYCGRDVPLCGDCHDLLADTGQG
jgi:hypothetical protein